MTDDFGDKIAQRITSSALKPRPKSWFLATRAALWALCGISVLIGAVAFATLIYYFVDRNRTGGKGFDEMPFDDFFEIVPYFWLACVLLAGISATLGFRATPRGFLWRPTSVLALTLALDVLIGGLVYATGLGPWLNRELADFSPSYAKLIAVEDWRNTSPLQGRLVGQSLGLNDSGQLILRDFTGAQWLVTVTDAQQSLGNPLGSADDLDIIGTIAGPNEFRATSITDWR